MKKLVYFGMIIPEPESTAAGKRTIQLFKLLQEMGCSISFLSTALPTEFSFPLQENNIAYYPIKLNDSSISKLLKELSPEVVIFDRFITEEQFGWRVAQDLPDSLRILDSQDLHFLRKARESSYFKGKDLENINYNTDIFKREIASIYRSDLTLIISQYEMNLLQNQYNIPSSILFYLPLFYHVKKSSIEFEQRANFMTIGNFLHQPNFQTCLKIKKIWPLLKAKIPHASMHIYGAYPNQQVLNLDDQKNDFRIKGRAIDKYELYENYRVQLSPIPFGAGLKGKILESMAYGLPFVTTPQGIEGIYNIDKSSQEYPQSDQEIIEKAVLLYTNKEMWIKNQLEGYKTIERDFDRENYVGKLQSTIKNLLENLNSHRSLNIIGSVLSYHSFKASKYFSRWIEEKNK